VVAALLAQSGRKVIVLEQGEALTESDYGSDEGQGFDRMFLKAGLLASEDVGIAVIAGRVLGGGTTVNWMTSFRPSDRLLSQWAEASGVPGLTGVGLQHSLDEVERRLNVGREEGALNAHNERLARGAEALGWHYAFQPRNAKGCGDCGLCTFGCRWGGKQSTPRTYLQDAYDAGAVVIARANASRVLIKGGRAFAVEATVGPVGAMPARAEGAQRLTVRAPLVVVAAGSIESPALLLRSGLRHRALGRNLYLHPATVVESLYDEDVPAWTGALQTAYSDQFADLDGRGYGVKFETTPIYPGLAATALAWEGGAAFKRDMLDLRHTGTLLLLCRDRNSGRVTIDRWGNAHIDYRLGRQESRHILHALKEGSRLLMAAGAREVHSLHTQRTAITRDERDDPAAWARYARRIDRLGAGPNNLMMFSAHQMGTCRMSASPSAGVVDGTGAVHGVGGLYVADASVFPLSSGVNPMITTMGLAHWIGSRLAE
jgi:choline dehydrogenase-like flavoprotein